VRFLDSNDERSSFMVVSSGDSSGEMNKKIRAKWDRLGKEHL
jgi:hypothetical protein